MNEIERQIDADLDSQRRVMQGVEELYQKHQYEMVRLEKIRAFIFKKKVALEGLDE